MATIDDIFPFDDEEEEGTSFLDLHPYLIAANHLAQQQSLLENQDCIQINHMLMGLYKENNGNAGNILRKYLTNFDNFNNLFQKIQTSTWLTPEQIVENDNKVTKAYQLAEEYAHKDKSPYLDTHHLARALFTVDKDNLSQIFSQMGLDYTKILDDLIAAPFDSEINLNSNQTQVAIGPTLSEYGINLTQMAKNEELDPVLGRDKEIDQVLEILHRRLKSNPLLVGPAGSGKTAIVEGLAQIIAQMSPKDPLYNTQIISLSMGTLVAGTKYRGELEEKIKKIIQEASKPKTEQRNKIVLFFDEIHTITKQNADIANLLKPALASGEISCIGATTEKEVRMITKDTALERRFRTINISVPTKEHVIEMIDGIKNVYEKYHNVQVPQSTVEAIVDCSGQYIHDRIWPDSAIDVLDEASVVAKHQTSKGERVNVTRQHVAQVISFKTKIPAEEILNTDGEKLLKLEGIIHEKLIGQETAVTELTKALRRSRAGLRDPKRPIGSFLFIGPTGVGKTYLAKVLAKQVFGTKDAFIRLDMSEFQESHAMARLIGAPPGYVGYNEKGGELTEALRQHPYSVLLLDEFEKAHPNTWKLFLQLLEDGRITDSAGKTVYANNCIIIMTSNVGSDFTQKSNIGFIDIKETHSTPWKNFAQATFPPELLGRLEIIPFNNLTIQDGLQIIDLETKDLLEKVRVLHNVTIRLDQNSLFEILKKTNYQEYGARAIKRMINDQIEQPLTTWLLNNRITPQTTQSITWKLDQNKPIIVEERPMNPANFIAID